MKIQLLIIIFFVFSYLESDAQMPEGGYIHVSFLKVPIEQIEKEVREKIKRWEDKGKYESLNEYSKRVNHLTLKKKNREVIQETINKYATDPFNRTIIYATFEYDTESETFKISIPNFSDIYINVPKSEAPRFDNNFNRIQYRNTNFSIEDNKYVVTETDIFNPVNSKTYHFNILEPVTFKSIIIENTWEPWIASKWKEKYVTQIDEDTITLKIGNSDVDIEIPETGFINNDVYALVIGNEDYTSFQTDLSTENDVDFAKNDALIFSKYLNRTVGIPDKHIDLRMNATYGQIKQALTRIATIAELKEGNIELIFYYAGHGLPDEITKEPYIIPIDISGTDIKSAIKLNDIYKQLTEYNPKKVTVFLDACFSGGGRNQGLLSLRGVKIKPESGSLSGNIVIFTSSSGLESSGSYKEKQHGIFTYFLLKKIQETKGSVSYKELADYLTDRVALESVIENNKKQTPQTLFGTNINVEWGTWKFFNCVSSK